jgi:hypothetical protein
VEQNAFPNLEKRKWKSVVVFYFTIMFVIPLLGSLFVSFNTAILLMMLIFGIPMALALIHMATSEEHWYDFRVRNKRKITDAGEKSKDKLSGAKERLTASASRFKSKIAKRKKQPKKRRLSRKW